MCTRTQCTAHKDLCTHTRAHTGAAHPCAHPYSTLAHAHVQARFSLTQLWSPRPVPWPSRLVWLGRCRGCALTPRWTRDLGIQDSSELLFSQGRVSPGLQHLPGPVCVETGEQQPPAPGWGCCWARLWELAPSEQPQHRRRVCRSAPPDHASPAILTWLWGEASAVLASPSLQGRGHVRWPHAHPSSLGLGYPRAWFSRSRLPAPPAPAGLWELPSSLELPSSPRPAPSPWELELEHPVNPSPLSGRLCLHLQLP